ncbi:hypothetical protein ACIA8C_06550 [Nocardia sp. NPDC051321]|uniref:hypothetical protein n=1 Tax=Nocardia sp. NPDC051321 TaxID=3364323 RepID=UPI0037B7C96C
MSDSLESATAYVIEALEAKGTATRYDFDVSGIVAESHAIANGWNFRTIEDTTFWGIVARFLRP